MSDDKIERQMAFIIEQQAKFSADIEALKERMSEITANVGKLTDVMLSLANIVERHDRQIETLIEQGKETDRRFKETDERINMLITALERHIGGHDGQ